MYQTPITEEDRQGRGFRFFGERPNPKYSREAIQDRVNQVPYWYHTIDFGYGITAPGHQASTWDSLGRTRLLRGEIRNKTVIDVGAWDGFFSFVSERMGAARVLATDRFAWESSSFGMQGFLAARDLLDSKVEYKKIDAMDLEPGSVGQFDVVLFLGVLYHLRDPFLALRQLRGITRDYILVETHIVSYLEKKRIPIMEFYETNELNNDPTNWWGPNLCCLQKMMRAAGFPRQEVVTVRYGDRRHGRVVVKGYVGDPPSKA